jgi:hypothetical protein
MDGIRVRRVPRRRILEVLLVNRGNVTETLERGHVRVVLRRGDVRVRLRAGARRLRPRTRGVVQLPYSGGLTGWVTAQAEIASVGGPVVRRTFRVKL